MRRITTLTAALLLTMAGSLARGQIRSVGPVPADLRMNVEELYEADMQRAEKYLGGRVRNKEQVLMASYHIGKMLTSGRIVYGDAVSRMLERIADTLLRDYPELRSELRFYTINSPEVNAFATGQGMVFVNLGLVAQAENEAQIAFVLSHEIIHYFRSHTLEELVGRRKRDKDTEMEEEQRDLTEFLRQHSRSREMENEADSLGIAMFYSRSPYDRQVSDGVFDVLQYGALPFDDVEFDTTFFNTPHYQLTGCWLRSVAPISSRDNYDDSRSSHPNILSRRRKCASLMQGKGGKAFVTIGREEFLALRHQARMECVRQEVIHGQYARAFYNAWLLRRGDCSEADARTLDRLMAFALYSQALHKVHETSVAKQDYSEVQGESQQVYYAMTRMTNEQALLTALHAVWSLHMRFPGQKEYSLMAGDLMEELRFSAKKNIGDYLEELPAPDSSTAVGDSNGISKYERIRRKRREQTEQTPSAYALTDLMMADSTLAPLLNRHLAGTAELEHIDTAGSNGMLLFNPTSIITDYLTNEIKVAKSAANEQRLSRRLALNCERLGMHSVDFSDDQLHQMTDAGQYNDFLTLCEWMNEFWLAKGAFHMHYSVQPEMDDLMDRHKTSRVNLTAMLNEEYTPRTFMFHSVLLPILLPVAFVDFFTGIENTAMATLTVDARRGEVLLKQNYSYQMADHNGLVDAMLYDSYIQGTTGKTPKGFLGRRAAIAVGTAFGMAGFSPLAQDHFVAFTPWLSLEYAIKRNYSLTAWARYHEGYPDVVNDNGTPLSSDQLTLGLAVRRYPFTSFAPYGFYRTFGVQWVRMQYYRDNSVHNTFGIHAGVGRNYVFLDRLIFNYEILYACTLGVGRAYFGSSEEDAMPLNDAFLSNLLTFKIGLGFLPF